MNLNKMIKKDEWYTPKYIVDMFGKFDLDTATSDYNLKRLDIPNGFTKENSALNQEWYGKVWCNPPFSMKNEFIEKAREEVNKGNCEVYMLLPMRMETIAVHKHIMNYAHLYIPNGRISFETPEGKTLGTPQFASVIVKMTKEKCNTYETIDIKRKELKND